MWLNLVWSICQTLSITPGPGTFNGAFFRTSGSPNGDKFFYMADKSQEEINCEAWGYLISLLSTERIGLRKTNKSPFPAPHQYLMMKSGSSRILLAMSRREFAPDGAKMEPGRSPVSEEQPASFSSIFSKTYLSMGRPSKYSSRFTIPPGPWYIQSSFSSFFLIQGKQKYKENVDVYKPTHKTWTWGYITRADQSKTHSTGTTMG